MIMMIEVIQKLNLFNVQVDTDAELDMKFNLHQCYVHLKQFTEAIHTVRLCYMCLFSAVENCMKSFAWYQNC